MENSRLSPLLATNAAAARVSAAWPVASGQHAAWIVALWTMVLLAVNLFGHLTPFYRVETALIDEYLPAARELARGVISVSHYAFKGPGYPLLLAWRALPLNGDVEVAARLLTPIAAGIAAWFAFALARLTLGPALVRLGVSGEGIIARKPHVAWYARMKYVPYPTAASLAELPALAHASDARYLFFSGIEQLIRPNDTVLADSGLALPGFEQVLWSRLPHGHFYGVYRFTQTRVDSATFAAAHRAALLRYEAKRPGFPEAMLFVAAQLYELGWPRESLERLERLERGGARDPAIERYRSLALLACGDLDAAARACHQAMTLEAPVAWHWQQLGEIRARQGNVSVARDAFASAVDIEPANLECLESLGRAEIALRNYAAAAAAFERCVRLAPDDITARREAMAPGIWRVTRCACVSYSQIAFPAAPLPRHSPALPRRAVTRRPQDIRAARAQVFVDRAHDVLVGYRHS